MSDVPISAEKLKCLLCPQSFTGMGGLLWHVQRRHQLLAPPAPRPGSSPTSGGASCTGGRAAAGPHSTEPGAASTREAPVSARQPPSGAHRPPTGARQPLTSARKRASAPLERNDGGAGAAALRPRLCLPRTSSGGTHVLTSATASMREGSDYHATVEEEVAGLNALTRVVCEPIEPARKRRRGAAANVTEQVHYQFATVATEVRTHFESMKDTEKAHPIIKRRKRSRPGKFDSFRLRTLSRFALRCGGAGLSLDDQAELYKLLDVWGNTMPGMPVDHGATQTLRDVFPSANAFKNALRDDVDDAVLGAGWRKCALEEDSLKFDVFFRPALDVVMNMMRTAKDVEYWSGGDQPALPSAIRETPMDGDAFREHEREVVREHGPDSFVLGMHVYSDASHVSRSGGKV